MLWLILFLAICLIVIYIFIIRPVIKNAPVLSPVFAAESSFMDRLRVRLVGWKTKIAARSVALGGVLLGMYDLAMPVVAGQDWTPITAKMPAWVVPIGMVLGGMLFGYLRKITENPPLVVTQRDDATGDLHVVALQKDG
jgi:hypothetical protein